MTMIKVHDRVAVIINNMGSAWSLKFLDTKEIVKVFYHAEEEWEIFIPEKRYNA